MRVGCPKRAERAVIASQRTRRFARLIRSFAAQRTVAQEQLPQNEKGCDIGYALATDSCEGTDSVDARTVTALDVSTAFAVPNPNASSQSRRFFRVWMLNKLPCRANHPAYFGLTNFI